MKSNELVQIFLERVRNLRDVCETLTNDVAGFEECEKPILYVAD